MEWNKAVFLDRDGVIGNHDPGDYTRSLEEFHVLLTVYDALAQLQSHGHVDPDHKSRQTQKAGT